MKKMPYLSLLNMKSELHMVTEQLSKAGVASQVGVIKIQELREGVPTDHPPCPFL